MSDMYAVKGSTLTAIGDAIRIHKPTRIEAINTGEALTVKNQKNLMMSVWGNSYFDSIGIKGASSVRLQIATTHPDGTMFYIYRGKYKEDEIANIEPYLTFDARIGRLLQGAMEGTEYEYFDIPDTDYLSLYMIGSTGSPNYAWYASLTGYDENGETIMKYEDVEVVNTMTPLQMADTISEFSVIPQKALTISGDCKYRFAYSGWDWFLETVGDKVTTENLTDISSMFYGAKVQEIPFDINLNADKTYNLNSIFCQSEIRTLPAINNLKLEGMQQFLNGNYYIREIPEDYGSDWDWSLVDTATSAYSGNLSTIVRNCYSLRKRPIEFYKHYNPVWAYTTCAYYNAFDSCASLDEIVDLPVYPITLTSNAFSGTFNQNYRIKELCFKTQEDGTPYTAPWKNQTIDIEDAGYVEFTSYLDRILDYNSGITADKKVIDDATYQALKNDPDWFSIYANYSRYNHDSAVNTINSLPDCSATGTNTIKFKGTAGAKTDGGAINTLTEEEIAVATAKGWTITLS